MATPQIADNNVKHIKLSRIQNDSSVQPKLPIVKRKPGRPPAKACNFINGNFGSSGKFIFNPSSGMSTPNKMYSVSGLIQNYKASTSTPQQHINSIITKNFPQHNFSHISPMPPSQLNETYNSQMLSTPNESSSSMNPDTTDEFFHSQNAHKTSDFKRKKYSDFPKKNLKLYSKPKGDQQSQNVHKPQSSSSMFANESHYTGCQLDFDESPAEPIKLGSLRKSLNEFPNTTKPQTSNNGELVNDSWGENKITKKKGRGRPSKKGKSLADFEKSLGNVVGHHMHICKSPQPEIDVVCQNLLDELTSQVDANIKAASTKNNVQTPNEGNFSRLTFPALTKQKLPRHKSDYTHNISAPILNSSQAERKLFKLKRRNSKEFWNVQKTDGLNLTIKKLNKKYNQDERILQLEEDLKASQNKNTCLQNDLISKNLTIKNVEERLKEAENALQCNKVSSEEHEKELKRVIEELKKENIENSNEIIVLGNQNNKLKEETLELKKKLQENQNELNKSIAEEDFKKKLHTMKNELIDKTKKANKFEKSYNNVVAVMNQNDKRVQALKAEKTELTRALKSSKDDYKKLNKTMDKMRKCTEKVNKKTKAVNEVSESTSVSNSELIKSLREQIYIAEEEMKTERLAKERLEKEIKDDTDFYNKELKGRKDEILEYNKVMIAINQNYEHEFEEKNKEIKYWNEKWAEQLTECENVKSREKEANDHIAMLESRLEDTKDHLLVIDAKEKLISEMESKLKDFEEKTQQNVGTDDSNFRKILEEKENLIVKLKNEVLHANEKAEQIQQKNSLNNMRFNTAIKKHKGREAELEQLFEDSNNRIQLLEDQLKRLQAENQQIKSLNTGDDALQFETNVRNMFAKTFENMRNQVYENITQISNSIRTNKEKQASSSAANQQTSSKVINDTNSETGQTTNNRFVNGSSEPVNRISQNVSELRLQDTVGFDRITQNELPQSSNLISPKSTFRNKEVLLKSPQDDDSIISVTPTKLQRSLNFFSETPNSPHKVEHVCMRVLNQIKKIFNVNNCYYKSRYFNISIDSNENLVIGLPTLSQKIESVQNILAYVPLISDPQTITDFHIIQLEKINPLEINLKDLSRVYVKETQEASLMMFVIFIIQKDIPSTKPYVFYWSRSKMENSLPSINCSTKEDIPDSS